LAGSAGAAAGPFRERRIAVSGAEIRLLEGGAGEPLLVLPATSGPSPSPALERLAGRYRVIALGLAAAAPRETAARAAAAAAALGVSPCDVLGTAAGALAALWLAADAPGAVRALVLESPPEPEADLAGRLPGVTVPALLLCGTRDGGAAPGPGVAGQRLLPNAFLTYLYDAGPDLQADRPAAFAAVVADFLARQGAFLVRAGTAPVVP
jgi:pimeloyl-ACP methyl ester carboxylesterase